MTKHTIFIGPDGLLKFIYDDDLLPLLQLGTASVTRASHVEPLHVEPLQPAFRNTGWSADLSPSGGPVLDTHLGSGSNRIAAHKAGNIDFTGYELDKDYYEAQEKRFEIFQRQPSLNFATSAPAISQQNKFKFS